MPETLSALRPIAFDPGLGTIFRAGVVGGHSLMCAAARQSSAEMDGYAAPFKSYLLKI
jgi:hypothetical protein